MHAADVRCTEAHLDAWAIGAKEDSDAQTGASNRPSVDATTS